MTNVGVPYSQIAPLSKVEPLYLEKYGLTGNGIAPYGLTIKLNTKE